jgi:hypothetical protein
MVALGSHPQAGGYAAQLNLPRAGRRACWPPSPPPVPRLDICRDLGGHRTALERGLIGPNGCGAIRRSSVVGAAVHTGDEGKAGGVLPPDFARTSSAASRLAVDADVLVKTSTAEISGTSGWQLTTAGGRRRRRQQVTLTSTSPTHSAGRATESRGRCEQDGRPYRRRSTRPVPTVTAPPPRQADQAGRPCNEAAGAIAGHDRRVR